MSISIEDFQRRIAKGSANGSSLRNQGAAGIVKAAQEFLAKLDIRRFAGAPDETSFQEELDRQTRALSAKMMWGTARKALNIFLCEAFYNRELFDHYNLGRIGSFLEVTLDDLVATELRKKAKDFGTPLPPFPGIKHMKPEITRLYQAFATRCIASENVDLRIHLEIRWWS